MVFRYVLTLFTVRIRTKFRFSVHYSSKVYGRISKKLSHSSLQSNNLIHNDQLEQLEPYSWYSFACESLLMLMNQLCVHTCFRMGCGVGSWSCWPNTPGLPTTPGYGTHKNMSKVSKFNHRLVPKCEAYTNSFSEIHFF